MNSTEVLTIVFDTLKTTATVAGPLLATGFAVGMVASLLQVVTSIQDITFTFIPKIVAVALVFFLAFNWISRMLVSFSVGIFSSLPSVAP
jgi:flagellar biosynthetic protein FliQ